MQKELFGKDFLKNPEELIIRVYGGADGNYTHYEDDGETEDYKDGRSCCFTSMHFDWERGGVHNRRGSRTDRSDPGIPWGLYQWNVWSERGSA